VYGSTKEIADSLRLFEGGKLKFSTHQGDHYLPLQDGENQQCWKKGCCLYKAGMIS
jgi:hypothetical protein